MRLLVTLFLIFVVYLVMKMLIGFASLPGRQRKRREESGGEMVQDPVCETYVPIGRAIEKKMNGQTVYFCSQPCMDAFFEKRRAS
ncbi:MAG: transcriptional regulator [Nitrospirae bacterium]|nr:transcriptional regulator [Nitrospirota bacterium]